MHLCSLHTPQADTVPAAVYTYAPVYGVSHVSM